MSKSDVRIVDAKGRITKFVSNSSVGDIRDRVKECLTKKIALSLSSEKESCFIWPYKVLKGCDFHIKPVTR